MTAGEPDAVKAACPVREGIAGKGPQPEAPRRRSTSLCESRGVKLPSATRQSAGSESQMIWSGLLVVSGDLVSGVEAGHRGKSRGRRRPTSGRTRTPEEGAWAGRGYDPHLRAIGDLVGIFR